MQINNIKIRWNNRYRKFQCVSPDKRILEEFDKEKDAQDWALETKDFLCKKL